MKIQKKMAIEHKSDDWFRARSGKFTPSELHRLMTEPKSKTEVLSVGAITYVKEKVTETLIDRLPDEMDFKNAATAWGNSYEDEAISLFADLVDMEIIKPGFIERDENFGGTPDGIAIDNSFGIEVKCPYNPSIHLDNLFLDSVEFKKARKEYYYQIQGYAILTGIMDWYFISYDPRQQEPFKLRHLKIEKDEIDVALINKKLQIASDYKQKLINNLKQLK